MIIRQAADGPTILLMKFWNNINVDLKREKWFSQTRAIKQIFICNDIKYRI